MKQSEFWKLFAETGEPYYWLLSRCENQPGNTQPLQPATTEAPAPILPAPQ